MLAVAWLVFRSPRVAIRNWMYQIERMFAGWQVQRQTGEGTHFGRGHGDAWWSSQVQRSAVMSWWLWCMGHLPQLAQTMTGTLRVG